MKFGKELGLLEGTRDLLTQSERKGIKDVGQFILERLASQCMAELVELWTRMNSYIVINAHKINEVIRHWND
jgi:hypothetical protein